MIRRLLMICCLCQLALAAQAGDDFGIWAGLGAEKKIAKGLSANIEGEFRSRNNTRTVERWSGSAGLSYKITKWLGSSVDYTFLYRYQPMEVTGKGNYIPEYWLMRHRLNVALTGKASLGRIGLSLRERWQYTYRPEQHTEKYDGRTGARKVDEVIKGKGQHALRSRLKVDYNIPKCKFTPYVACELTHSLMHGFYYDKTRLTLGTEWKLAKRHGFDFYYVYQDRADADEADGHVLGVAYKFKF